MQALLEVDETLHADCELPRFHSSQFSLILDTQFCNALRRHTETAGSCLLSVARRNEQGPAQTQIITLHQLREPAPHYPSISSIMCTAPRLRLITSRVADTCSVTR